MKHYIVNFPTIHIRSGPGTDHAIVGEAVQGDVIAVADESETLGPNGFVWHRIHQSSFWVAEYNWRTGQRLLEPHSETPVTRPAQQFIVQAAVLNIRTDHHLNAPVSRSVHLGDIIEVEAETLHVCERHWVWRKLAGSDNEWIAEFNQVSGHRHLKQHDAGAVNGRVTTHGGIFMLDGKPFRFAGANMRELAFYGRGVSSRLMATTRDHQLMQVAAMRSMGMRVVRLHVCHKNVPIEKAIGYVRETLDLLDQAELLAILCLNDSRAESGCYIPGEMALHQFNHSHGHLDKTYFTNELWQTNYLPYVELMVRALHSHRAIFAWELGNDWVLLPQPITALDSAGFVAFVHTVAGKIRELDPDHLISIGLSNTAQVAPETQSQQDFAQTLYASHLVNFGTLHIYQDARNPDALLAPSEGECVQDANVLKHLGKPFIVEAFSAMTGDRRRYTEKKMDEWLRRGAAGFMQWGLAATQSDVGVGGAGAMDNYSSENRPHFDRLKTLYAEVVALLNQL